MGEMDELPLQEMSQLWKNEEYRRYLTIFEKWLHESDWSAYRSLRDEDKQTIRDQSCKALSRLTYLWKSHNQEIHCLIQSIYYSSVKVKSFTIRELQVIAYNEYLRRILCREVMRFVDISIPQFIEASEFLLEETFLEQQTLKVEENLRQCNNRPSDGDDYICALQRISVEFMETLYIYPLTDDYAYPERAGVYFIYYIGKTALYDGEVKPSIARPIYVGKSKKNISERLKDHREKIERAVDLEVDDFIVRLMLVDIKFYAGCIEEMLIDYFRPKWNKEWGWLSFGNARSETNSWNRYHIQNIR